MKLIILLSYYHFNICSIPSDVPTFIPHIDNLYLLSHSFFFSLLTSLAINSSILLIFSKNQILVSLIFSIDFLIFCFIEFTFLCFFPHLLLTLSFVCSLCLVSYGGNQGHGFETFLKSSIDIESTSYSLIIVLAGPHIY